LIAIDDILISDDIFEEQFVCDLQKCKGACCVEGDSGAPVLEEERPKMQAALDKLSQILPQESLEEINQKGVAIYDSEDKTYKTTLNQDGTCSFAIRENGILFCGFERLYQKKEIDFPKPISCHLYPIRISELGSLTTINYEVWNICADACLLGKEMQIPVYKFVQNAIKRKFGTEFYAKLDDYYTQNYRL
jgi:hypothetical protein